MTSRLDHTEGLFDALARRIPTARVLLERAVDFAQGSTDPSDVLVAALHVVVPLQPIDEYDNAIKYVVSFFVVLGVRRNPCQGRNRRCECRGVRETAEELRRNHLLVLSQGEEQSL